MPIIYVEMSITFTTLFVCCVKIWVDFYFGLNENANSLSYSYLLAFRLGLQLHSPLHLFNYWFSKHWEVAIQNIQQFSLTRGQMYLKGLSDLLNSTCTTQVSDSPESYRIFHLAAIIFKLKFCWMNMETHNSLLFI